MSFPTDQIQELAIEPSKKNLKKTLICFAVAYIALGIYSSFKINKYNKINVFWHKTDDYFTFTVQNDSGKVLKKVFLSLHLHQDQSPKNCLGIIQIRRKSKKPLEKHLLTEIDDQLGSNWHVVGGEDLTHTMKISFFCVTLNAKFKGSLKSYFVGDDFKDYSSREMKFVELNTGYLLDFLELKLAHIIQFILGSILILVVYYFFMLLYTIFKVKSGRA